MIIYWNSGVKNSGGLPGRKQNIDYCFDYAGKRRCIPAIYRFAQGVVFDVVTVLDESELRAFHDKYRDAEKLTSPQRRAAESEHPYQSVPLWKVTINGMQPPDGWSSTGSFHAPYLEEGPRLEKEAKAYKKQIKGSSSFACDRYTIPLRPEPASRRRRLWQWLFSEKIDKIEIEINRTTRFLPIELAFTLPHDFSGTHIETFMHPQTQTQHTLYFQRIEHHELPLPTGNGGETLYASQLSYEITPELSEGDQLQFGSDIRLEQKPVQPGGFLPQSISAIGIIGGSDGPTAIFMTGQNSSGGPCGAHGLPLRHCFSALSVKKESLVNVFLEGINVRRFDAQTLLWEPGGSE